MNAINKALDEALINSVEKKDQVEQALLVYKSPFGSQMTDVVVENGFNGYLVHDYTIEGSPFIYELIGKTPEAEVIYKSIYSIFKVHIEGQNIIFKDVITSRDYVVKSDQLFEDGDLITVRLYPENHHFMILDNPVYYPDTLEAVIRKSVMHQYNVYCSMNEPMHIEEFVKKHSQLVYHLTNIIDFYESELDDDLEVYVATYAVKDKEAVLDALLDTNDFQLIEKDGDEVIIEYVSEGAQLAEIVVSHASLEIEVTSKSGLRLVKELVDDLIKDHGTFIKEATLSMDDLLS